MEYRPYRTHKFMAPIMLVCASVFWVLFGFLLSTQKIAELLILLIMAILATVIQHYFYATAKASVIFESDGLRVLNDGKHGCSFFAWEALPYGYYSRSMKGHRYLVLTDRLLDEKQIKKIADKSANTTRICLENSVTIFLDPLQDTSKIETWLDDKIIFKGKP